MGSALATTQPDQLKRCPFCAEEIQAAAIVCKHCGRDVGAGREPAHVDETLAQAMLLVPIIGCLLIWFWIGSMNLFQNPEASLWLVGIGTVLATAGLAASDAGRLGMGIPGDPHREHLPITWFWLIALLWIVCFPAYLHRRRKYGARSLLVGGILVALIFSVSAVGMGTAIDAQREKVRAILR